MELKSESHSVLMDKYDMEIQIDLVIASRIYREGIAAYLLNCSGVKVNKMIDSVAEALLDLEHSCADVVIVDNLMDSVLSLVDRLKRKSPAPFIIMLITDHDETLIKECIAAGAEGFISNTDSMDDLAHCISLVFKGHCCYPGKFSKYAVNSMHKPVKLAMRKGLQDVYLTCRQTLIVQLIETGMSNKEIARKLGIQLPTVKNHVHQILDRLNVKSRYEAAAYYRRMNLDSSRMI